MIQRRTPLKRTRLKPRSAPPKRSTTPVRKRRPGPPRRGPASVPSERWRNPAYREFLKREGRCIICGAGGCDPCHGPVAGTSMKGADSECVPMDREHHDEQTRIGWARFVEQYNLNREALAAKWWGRFRDSKK